MDNSASSSRTMVSSGRDELDALLEKGGDGSYPLCHIAHNFLLYERTPNRERSCFRSVGTGIFVSASTFFALGMMPVGEMV